MVGGHSYGELVALHAAGVLDADGAGRAVAGARPLHARGRARGAPARWRPSWPVPTRSSASIRDVPGRAGRQLERPEADGDRRAEPRPSSRHVELAAARGIGGRLLPVSSRLPHAAGRRGARAAGAPGARSAPPVARPAGVFQPRRRPPPRRPAGDRGPAGRSSRQPRPVRRDDRGDVPRRGARVRRGRTGVDPDPAGRVDPAGSAASGGLLRRAAGRRACPALLGGSRAWSSPGCRSGSSG